MQSPDSGNQCPSEINTDGGRDTEQRSFEAALGMALAQILNLGDRAVHLAEADKPVNLSANLYGRGKLRTL